MRIFVNYRTNDEANTALLATRHLSERIGERNVFLDHRSIGPGTLFDDAVMRNLWRSDVLVAIMGERWLEFPGHAGGRAIDDPRDWIHKEIAEALTHRVRVVPLLVGAVALPREEELPEPLKDLVRHRYIVLERRVPQSAFDRLDQLLDLPTPDGGDEPRRRGNVTDARGCVHLGDWVDRRGKGKR